MSAVKRVKGPRLREAKKQEVQRAIVSAAMVLFEDHGFDATTMDEIASRANVSRPTVFNYFSTKEAILPAAVHQMMEDLLAVRAPPIKAGQPDSPVALIKEAIVGIGAAFGQNPETARAFFVHHMQKGRSRRRPVRGRDRARAQDPRVPAAEPDARECEAPFWQIREQIFERMVVLMARAQAEGCVRKDFEPAELVRLVFVGLFAATIGPWLWGHLGDKPLAEVVSRHFNFFVDGLLGSEPT